MSRPAVAASLPLPFELVFDDGIPMDDFQHPLQLELFRNLTHEVMAERGRRDYTIGGDNFVYYSLEQAEDVVKGRPYFRGPDIFFVDGIPPREDRRGWVAWEEGGRLPDLIVEILSPSTAHIDRKDKRELYARVFRTREYYLLDLEKKGL
ncbi:MAG TPA: Uma2 family endonuclease, partial [Thermoanaerobaculia bacterium]|nr:Uma2 family endonuclease [Thermoanaerobaculia bacterium]